MPVKPDLPPEPEFGAPLAASHESAETLALLALRRSTPVAALTSPGPSADEIDALLRCGLRAPDHRKLEPWRVLVIAGEARSKLGDLLAAARLAGDPAAAPEKLDADRRLPLRAPLILCVISTPVVDVKGTPEWEQQLSAGAVCQNIMIAASAMGWAASWISEWPAYDPHVAAALGMKDRDRIAGFIYVGTAKEQPIERQRPDLATKVERW